MRTCNGCSLCCTLLAVNELTKPAGVACQHSDGGCSIYPDRPTTCRQFKCLWLDREDALGEHWKPAHSHIVAFADRGLLSFVVDPAYPDAWREHLDDITRLAGDARLREAWIVVGANAWRVQITSQIATASP